MVKCIGKEMRDFIKEANERYITTIKNLKAFHATLLSKMYETNIANSFQKRNSEDHNYNFFYKNIR